MQYTPASFVEPAERIFGPLMGTKTDAVIDSAVFPADAHIEVSTANSWASSFDKMSDKPFYPHLLRHAFTTRLYKAGIPESVIQALQNWESIDMVSVYLDCSVDEQIEMYFKDGDIAPRSQKGLNDL